MQTLDRTEKSTLMNELTRLQKASREIRVSPRAVKDAVLNRLSLALTQNESKILEANAKDLANLPADSSPAFRDRLLLTPARLQQMRESLTEVTALPDPIGEVADRHRNQEGLLFERVRSPLGIVFLIFESRPNVITEAFSLALKSGNAIIMRGGKESTHTAQILFGLIEKSFEGGPLKEKCFWGIHQTDRAWVHELLQAHDLIDVVVPRGGEKLIQFVVQNTKIPIIKNDRGLCHIYVHSDADLKMAEEIAVNAKTQRPGVCNSMESLLVHRACATSFLPILARRMHKLGVEWKVCSETAKLDLGPIKWEPASKESFATEFLDLKMNCRIVDSLEEAMDHIATYGSRHSECVITRDEEMARKFQGEVDAAAIYWNASTRFTDGYAMGLGGELGISTQKLHVRGPVGLRELTSLHWRVTGTGQIRK